VAGSQNPEGRGWCKVQGSGFRVQGSGFRGWGQKKERLQTMRLQVVGVSKRRCTPQTYGWLNQF